MAPSDPADQERLAVLVGRVAQGADAAAFTELYLALAGSMYAASWRVSRDRELARDATQDALAEIWLTARRYTPERGTVRSWAQTIARFRAIDQVRTHRARADRELRAGPAVREPPSEDPVAELVGRRCDHQAVRDALGALSYDQHLALVLAYYHRLSPRQIAEKLDIPLPTVKSRLRNALDRLRRHLHRLGPGCP
jgi:RNA polymerase sigma-70 factor, ECF subfamily